MSDLPKCPRCNEGVLVKATLNEPSEYSCGHQDYLADLRARPVNVWLWGWAT